MNDLERFTAAYIECALWSSTDDSERFLSNRGYSTDDIDAETLAAMHADCARFVTEQRTVLDACDESGALPFRNDESRERGIADAYAMAGHDFWLTRNGHGAGFWDGDWDLSVAPVGNAGDVLTRASKAFGEFDLYVGDDGVIYGSPLSEWRVAGAETWEPAGTVRS